MVDSSKVQSTPVGRFEKGCVHNASRIAAVAELDEHGRPDFGEVMELDISSLEAGDNCRFFREQRNYEAAQAARITWVVFAIILTVAACLIGLIIAVSVKSWGASAATAVGSIVSGTAMRFILRQRQEHRSRAEKWVRAIEKAKCPDA